MNDEQVNEIETIRQSQIRKICFEVRATALRPLLHHREGFHYPLLDPPQRDLQQEITTTQSTQFPNSILYTRGSIKPIEITSSW